MDDFLEEIPSTLFREWIAFSILEPFGGFHEDARAGQISAAIANWSPRKDPKKPPVKPSEFFQSLKDGESDDEHEQTPEEAIAIFKAAMGVQ